MEEPGSQFTPGPGSRETYRGGNVREGSEEASPSQSPRWVFPCLAVGGLSLVPLARESMHGREGAGAVAVYLAVGAITLGVAAVIRGIYVLLTQRNFVLLAQRNFWWSPWVFLLAAVVAILMFLGQSAGPAGLISAPQREPTECAQAALHKSLRKRRLALAWHMELWRRNTAGTYHGYGE